MSVSRIAALLLLSFTSGAAAQEAWESEIVREGADGTLTYTSDAEGNRVPDFSHAGYRGGETLPKVPVVLTITPLEGDDTARIQAALDAAGARTPDARGFRGAVLLTAGEYQISGTLRVRASGVVLRGAGDGEDLATSTILRRSGTSQEPVVILGAGTATGGRAIIQRDGSRGEASVTDAVVPIGATALSVDQPGLFASGDDVVVFHPATAKWIAAVDGGGTFDDPDWQVGEMPIALARTVARVKGNTLTLDAPTFTQLDASLSPSTVYHRDRSGVIENVGLEDLRIDIETASPTSETHAEDAVRFLQVEHAWASGVTALHFWHAGFSVQNSRYVTVQDSEALEPHSEITGERRYNFEVERSQLVLFQRNRATEARHAYVGNGETLDSGIVFLDNVSQDASTSSEAHQTWGTGFLWDNHTELGSTGNSWVARRIHMGNRGSYGTSHGWSCAGCVAWNADMNGAPLIVEKPPTAQNYAIGTQGPALDSGPFVGNTGAFIEGTDRAGLSPQSLYTRQRQDRLAPTTATAPPQASGVQLQPLAPNPARETSTIRFTLSTPSAVRLSLYDVLGREVAVLARGLFGTGAHTTTLNARGVTPGVYIVRLAAEGASAVQRVTVSR